MIVYAFEYCHCIYESGYSVVSMHTTKRNAYKAMLNSKYNDYLRWYNDRITYGKTSEFNYDFATAYIVGEYEILE